MGPETGVPTCEQTDRLKTLPSRRTSYEDGKHTLVSNIIKEIEVMFVYVFRFWEDIRSFSE